MTSTNRQKTATIAAVDNALESGQPLLERAAALFLAAQLEKHHFSPADTALALGITPERLRVWCSTEQVLRAIGDNVGVNPGNTGVNESNTSVTSSNTGKVG